MKKALKPVLWILIFFFICVFSAIAFLPTWISTESGKNHATIWINKVISGEISVDQIDLNWFGTQKIDHFQYRNPKEGETFSFDHFETKTSLLYILLGGNKWNDTLLQSPSYEINEKEKKINEKESKKKTDKKKKKNHFPLFKIPNFKELTVKNGNLTFTNEQLTPITLSDIEVVKESRPDVFHITGRSLKDKVEGEITVSGSFDPHLHLLADIKNFPVVILDQLMDTTRYTQVLGETMSIQIDAEKQKGQTKIDANISASNLQGKIKGYAKKKEFIITSESSLHYTMTQSLFQDLFPQKEWVLANKPIVTLNIQEGIIPIKVAPNMNNTYIKATGSMERVELSHKLLGPYSLSNFTFTVNIDHQIDIQYSGDLQGKEKSHIEGDVNIDERGKVKFKSDFKGFPYSLLSLLSIKEGESLKNLFTENIDLSIQGVYDNKKTDIHFNLTTLGLKASGHVYGPTPETMKFTMNGEKTIIGKKGEFIGKKVQFNLDGLATYSEDSFAIPLFSGTIFNPFLDLEIKGHFGEKGERFSFAKSDFIAKGTISNLPIKEHNFQAMIKNGTFTMNAEGAKNLVAGKIQMTAAVNSNGKAVESKGLEIQFDIKNLITESGNLDVENANMSFQANLEKFPVPFLSAFMPEGIYLSKLIGPVIDLKAAGTYTPKKEPHIEMDIDTASEGFRGRFSFAIDETLNIRQPKPGFISWELTPERYQHLMDMIVPEHKKSHFYLMQPSTIELQFNQLTCPASIPDKDKLSTLLCQSGFNGTIEASPLFLKDRATQEHFSIQNMRGEIAGENFSKAIYLNLHGNIFSPDIPQEENAGFSFQGNMLNFWSEEGKFNRENLTVDGELSLELLPVIPLTEIIPLDQETKKILRAVLGPLVNARISGQISQMSGPLTIDVKASNFKAILPIQLSPNHITLRQYVEAEITLTEAVSETFLKDINPLFITGAYSAHPLKLYIYPEGLSIPIRPYSFQSVQIGKAVLDIGKIQVRNGGQLQSLMQFLKAKDVTPDRLMTAWFSPIVFSLNNGVSSYSRFDILLAEHFHIALWGHINLITNQVNMTLGISPSTLKKRFHISGLSKKEMFQVQMRGTTSNLDLDWSSAHTRIGILVASSAGGHIGVLIGGIIEQIVTALGDEVTPPPTTPLPWE